MRKWLNKGWVKLLLLLVISAILAGINVFNKAGTGLVVYFVPAYFYSLVLAFKGRFRKDCDTC